MQSSNVLLSCPTCERRQPVQGAGVRTGFDFRSETIAIARPGRDRPTGELQYIVAEGITGDHGLAGRPGEVPGVDEELDRQDAGSQRRRRVRGSKRHRSLDAPSSPGLECLLGSVGDPRLPGGRVPVGDVGSCDTTEEMCIRDRS